MLRTSSIQDLAYCQNAVFTLRKSKDISTGLSFQPRANRYVTDYRDSRLPCLCTNPLCPDDTELGFSRILHHPTFLGPTWLKIKDMSETTDLLEQYPHFHGAVYTFLEEVKTLEYYSIVPNDGFKGFKEILDDLMWRMHHVKVDNLLVGGLWRFCPPLLQERIECIVQGRRHQEMQEDVLLILKDQDSLMMKNVYGEETVESLYSKFLSPISLESFEYRDQNDWAPILPPKWC
jgi:hypothetical protein